MSIDLTAALLLGAAAMGQGDPSPVERAATQPLRDTRIQDEEIPEVLQLAASAPYSMRGTG